MDIESTEKVVLKFKSINDNLDDLKNLFNDSIVEKEYQAVHQILVRLGVTNADDLEKVIGEELGDLGEDVTEEHAKRFLAAFSYDSGHSKLGAAAFGGEILSPLARFIRLDRIWWSVVDCCQKLGDLQSDTVNELCGLRWRDVRRRRRKTRS